MAESGRARESDSNGMQNARHKILDYEDMGDVIYIIMEGSHAPF